MSDLSVYLDPWLFCLAFMSLGISINLSINKMMDVKLPIWWPPQNRGPGVLRGKIKWEQWTQ